MIFILAFQVAGVCHAGHYQLFKDGRPHRKYAEVLRHLQPKDTVGFSNGDKFEIGTARPIFTTYSVLLTTIENQILRIPGQLGGERPRSFINRYIQGLGPLGAAGVPVVNVIKSLMSEYVLEEKLAIETLLKDWLTTDAARDPEAAQPLRKFLLSTWRFGHIGDFRAEQVGLVDDRWILFDWTDDHLLYVSSPSRVVLSEDSAALALSSWMEAPEVKQMLLNIHAEIKNLREVDLCQEALVDREERIR